MEHGGDLSQALHRYGGSPEDWLDLSTGINPWPWPVPEHPSRAWCKLPSRNDETALIAAASRAYGVPTGATVVPAPGTQALIGWIPHLAPDGVVAIVGPTYGEHARCWRRARHTVIEIGKLANLPGGARHAVLVNPNNPDGRVTERDAIAHAAARIADRGGWLVVDESFADLEPAISVVDLCADAPVVVLRSFGKFYGLAGLRLGFAVAPPSIAQRIAEALGPWAVSGPALAIGAAALRDTPWADETRRRLAAETAALDAILTHAGLIVIGGTTLFRLAYQGDAHSVHEALARRHIWTRRFAHNQAWLRFGLPHGAVARERLAAALGEIC